MVLQEHDWNVEDAAGSAHVLRPWYEHSCHLVTVTSCICVLVSVMCIYSDTTSGSYCFLSVCCQIIPASAHLRQKIRNPVNQRTKTNQARTTES